LLSNRIRRLVSPPRPVPLPVVCSTMYGVTGVLGGSFLILGLIFTIVFTGGLRPIDEFRLAFGRATAQGTVTHVSGTNATENDEPVYEYAFAFTTRREERVTGRCYTTGRQWSVEDDVTVEYLPEDPGVARIQGARMSEFAPWVLFVLIFPIIGGMLFGLSAIGGLRQVMLLRHGLVADARIQSERPTGVTINDEPLIEYTYELITSSGQVFDGTAKALPTGRIGDETPEPALYLPSNPRISTLVDALPLSYPLDVDGLSGQWIPQGGTTKAVVYVLTWLAAIALTGYWLLTTFGGLR
jgi:hypothetical protein